MNNLSTHHNRIANNVSPEARAAWNIWKTITDFSEWLWDQYELEFMALAASQPPPQHPPVDDLPF